MSKIIKDLKPVDALVQKLNAIRHNFRTIAENCKLSRLSYPDWTSEPGRTIVGVSQIKYRAVNSLLLTFMDRLDKIYYAKITIEDISMSLEEVVKSQLRKCLEEHLQKQMAAADDLISQNLTLQDKIEEDFR